MSVRNGRVTRQLLEDRIPGDLIEAGAWRGGAMIFMRAILAAYGDEHRLVRVADSFSGLPPPNPKAYPADAGLDLSVHEELSVSLDEVAENFHRYGLLDNQVRFLPGWFHETLLSAPIQQLAVIRLDGDLYESIWKALCALYPKLSPGGFLIVDDYGALPACRKAVNDFRDKQGITGPIEQIDWTGVFWRRGMSQGAAEPSGLQ